MKTASVTAEDKKQFVISDHVSSGGYSKIFIYKLNDNNHIRSANHDNLKCFAITQTDFLFSRTSSKVNSNKENFTDICMNHLVCRFRLCAMVS